MALNPPPWLTLLCCFAAVARLQALQGCCDGGAMLHCHAVVLETDQVTRLVCCSH